MLSIILGWHQLHQPVKLDSNFSVWMKCNSPKQYLDLSVQPDHSYMIHSCGKLNLTILGSNATHGQTDAEVIILAVDQVNIDYIHVPFGLQLYSDANVTCIKHITAAAFKLDIPNKSVYITEGNYSGTAISITGPRVARIQNTIITSSHLTVSLGDEVIIRNSTLEDLHLSKLHVKLLTVEHNSTLDLTLNKCKRYTMAYTKSNAKFASEEKYCSDSKVTVSRDSSVRFSYEWELNKYFVAKTTTKEGLRKGIKHITSPTSNQSPLSELIEDFNLTKTDRCRSTINCFKEKKSELLVAVGLNKINQIARCFKNQIKNLCNKLLLIEAAKTNALYSLQFLFSLGCTNVSEADEKGRTPLHHSALHDSVEVALHIFNISSVTLNAKEQSGGTPLHRAAEGDSKRCGHLCHILQ